MPQPGVAVDRSDPRGGLSVVARYYDEKTARILDKYGPGPRVHFHTGLDAMPATGGLHVLRAVLTDAQERLMAEIARDVRPGRVIDVGCGLGGTAIGLALRAGVQVTAITNVAAHVPLVVGFAARAGVGITAVHRDAHDLAGLGTFDHAVAVESSCYFDRARWFAELARVMRPGARVHVVDCFASRARVAERFDGYWKTRVGSTSSYDEDAERAGFALERSVALGPRVLGFWDVSVAWNEAAMAARPRDRDRLRASSAEHLWLRDAIAAGDVEYVRRDYALTPQ